MIRRADRLGSVPPIGVDALGAAADAAGDPEILRLENLDTDLPPPPEALAATPRGCRECGIAPSPSAGFPRNIG